jgi:[protein-PII] uridylyltransferase
VLARDADPRAEPALMVRAARAAAQYRLPLGQHTLERFAAESAPMPEPWPAAARDEFVTLLGLGHAAIAVLESLDLAGLLDRLLPEWAAVRCRAQHSPVHRFTVDRHLLESAANAALQTREVDRPDLLLVGALLHDIGKGYPGDHSVVGAEHAAAIARRMGFAAADVGTIRALARHHLLLPDTATRRDLDDPRTVELVAGTVESVELLDLLHALAVADGIATGTSAAWSDWKAGLVADLAHRARAVVRGAPLPDPPPLDDLRRTLAEAGALAVVVDGEVITVAAPDAPGTLHRTAGVLALHALDVRSASISTHRGMAVNSFVVNPRFGRLPDPALIRTDLAAALDGRLDLAERLHAKERTYGPARESAGPATVHWFDDAATDATVLEFRADDAIGLLFRVTAALERSGLDVRSARISSLGGAAVDAFYLSTPAGGPVPPVARRAVEAALAGV